jgi:hypothetical protein
MSHQQELDLAAAHRHFSVTCFNAAWDLIDHPDRGASDDEQLLLRAMASLWHWTQREDRTEANLAIGHWLVSRAYALLGQAENARRHASKSLDHCGGSGPFYSGYAYEALARAESLGGNPALKAGYLERARRLAGEVTDPRERDLLLADLAGLG